MLAPCLSVQVSACVMWLCPTAAQAATGLRSTRACAFMAALAALPGGNSHAPLGRALLGVLEVRLRGLGVCVLAGIL